MTALLSKAIIGEELYMFLSVLLIAINLILVREDAGGQKLIYYINKILRDPKIRYSRAEKIIYMVVTSAQWLQPYFQMHLMVVLIDQPQKSIL